MSIATLPTFDGAEAVQQVQAALLGASRTLPALTEFSRGLGNVIAGMSLRVMRVSGDGMGTLRILTSGPEVLVVSGADSVDIAIAAAARRSPEDEKATELDDRMAQCRNRLTVTVATGAAGETVDCADLAQRILRYLHSVWPGELVLWHPANRLSSTEAFFAVRAPAAAEASGALPDPDGPAAEIFGRLDRVLAAGPCVAATPAGVGAANIVAGGAATTQAMGQLQSLLAAATAAIGQVRQRGRAVAELLRGGGATVALRTISVGGPGVALAALSGALAGL